MKHKFVKCKQMCCSNHSSYKSLICDNSVTTQN